MSGSENHPLEAFEVEASPFGSLFGAFLASQAIPDSFFLMHTGVGCKLKGQGILEPHDWIGESHTRQCHTEFTDLDIITGTARRILPYARSWYRRRNSGVMVLVTSTPAEMIGEDFAQAAQEAQDELGIPVLYVPTPGHRGDLWDGYGRVQRAVLESMPLEGGQANAGGEPGIGLVGYLFDRYEGDCTGDIRELRRMVSGALGLGMGPVLLDGTPYKLMGGLNRDSVCSVLPYGHAAVEGLCDRLGSDHVIQSPLPIGLAGSAAWLKGLCDGLGRDRKHVEDWIHSEVQPIRDIKRFRSELGSIVSATVAADASLAAGLTIALAEMGIPTRLIFLLDRSLGGSKRYQRDLQRYLQEGTCDETSPRIVERPGAARFIEVMQQEKREEGFDLLLAPTTLTNLVDRSSTATLELGFPRYREHYFTRSPLFGFRGAAHLWSRVANAMMRLDLPRRPLR